MVGVGRRNRGKEMKERVGKMKREEEGDVMKR